MTSTSTLALETLSYLVERLEKPVIYNNNRLVILSDKVVEEGWLLAALLWRWFPAMIGDLVPVILPLCVRLMIEVLNCWPEFDKNINSVPHWVPSSVVRHMKLADFTD
jgi:hypothetical protein